MTSPNPPNPPSDGGGNPFASDPGLVCDQPRGRLRDRQGRPTLGLTAEFWHGLATSLGPDSPGVLKNVGRRYGHRLFGRFAADCGKPPAELAIAEFAASLSEFLSRQGWGRLAFDLTRFEDGLILARVADPFETAAGGRDDAMLAGLLAGLFSELSGEALDCAITQARADGGCRLVVSLPERLAGVPAAVAEGVPHDEIIRGLMH